MGVSVLGQCAERLARLAICLGGCLVATSAGAAVPAREMRAHGVRVFVAADSPGGSEVHVCTTYPAGWASVSEADVASAVLTFDLLSGLAKTDPKLSTPTLSSRGITESSQLASEFAQYCMSGPRSEVGFMIYLEANRRAGRSVNAAALKLAQAERLKRIRLGALGSDSEGEARLWKLAFAGHSLFGSGGHPAAASLEALSFGAVQSFYTERYVRSSVAMAVVGGVGDEEVVSLIEAHFGQTSRAPGATPPAEAERHPQTSERYSTIVNKVRPSPLSRFAWVVPTMEEAPNAHLALQLAHTMLASELGKARNPPLPVDRVAGDWVNQSGLNLFQVVVWGKRDLSTSALHRVVDDVLKRWGGPSFGASELDQAKSAWLEQLDARLREPLFRARVMSERLLRREPPNFDQEARGISQLEAEEFRKAVREYLAPTRRTMVDVLPSVLAERGPRLPRYHIVSAGETMTSIARDARVSLAALQKANPGVRSTRLSIGQKLVLPPSTLPAPPAPEIYRVKAGDTLSAIAKRYGVSVKTLRQANRLRVQEAIRVGQELVIPVKSR